MSPVSLTGYAQQRNRPLCHRVFPTENDAEAAAMGLLFYLTLFIALCVFGWSVKGAS
jgi:hypothetical protein